jgi:hypothetical protein
VTTTVSSCAMFWFLSPAVMIYQMSRRQAQLEKSTRLGCEREWLTAVVAKVYTDRPKWLE